MTLEPTLEGGLRIGVDTALDWMLLRCIPADARLSGHLADRLGEMLEGDPGQEDWQDYVVPDLRNQFDTQLQTVEKALSAVTGDEPGEIFIRPQEAMEWYGALNQARLALEERYRFPEDGPAPDVSPSYRIAWLRDRMYAGIQFHLIEHVLR